MHKREDNPVSRPIDVDQDEMIASSEGTEPVSPARARAADQIVKRATHGLIRLETRRRIRHFARRAFYTLLIVGTIAGLYYFFAGETPTELLSGWWEDIKAKLIPVFSDSAVFPESL